MSMSVSTHQPSLQLSRQAAERYAQLEAVRTSRRSARPVRRTNLITRLAHALG